MNDSIIIYLKEFIENEARSCSMDFGCVTDFGLWFKINGSWL